jgi:hypothetical protein
MLSRRAGRSLPSPAGILFPDPQDGLFTFIGDRVTGIQVLLLFAG